MFLLYYNVNFLSFSILIEFLLIILYYFIYKLIGDSKQLNVDDKLSQSHVSRNGLKTGKMKIEKRMSVLLRHEDLESLSWRNYFLPRPPRYNIYEAMHHGPTMAHNTLEEEEEEGRGGVCMCATCGDETRAHAANTPNTRGLYRIGGRQITLISASQYSYGAAREPGRNVDLLVSGGRGVVSFAFSLRRESIR